MAEPLFGIKLASHFVPVEEMLGLAVHAETRGFHSVWTTEGRMAPDAVTTTAAIAARTSRVRIGTSVLNPFSRTPGLIAITAASIDRISGGRFVLGIGAGDPATLKQQHVPYQRPITRLTEYVTVIRRLLDGETVDHASAMIHVSGLAMDFRPRQHRLPIYVAATGPRAIAVAARIGDGILLNVGLQRQRARRIGSTRTTGTVVVSMHDDHETAVRAVKPVVVTYLTRFPAIARISGVPDSLVKDLANALPSGMDSACALLPDSTVAEFAAAGTPEHCRQWIAEYATGLDEVLLTPAAGDPAEIIDELAGLLRRRPKAQ
jgi:5,10-methylenetetrahydromethanopterin reductase